MQHKRLDGVIVHGHYCARCGRPSGMLGCPTGVECIPNSTLVAELRAINNDTFISQPEAPLGGDTPSTIAARQSTHGVFSENTKFIQAAKDLARQGPNWATMPAYQREAVDMLMHKIGRILYGDPSHLDHWVDISGYSDRVVKTIKGDLSP